MELTDLASPVLSGIDITSDPRRAFRGANEIVLLGSRPRTKGMERKDLLRVNGPIFVEQGRAIAEQAAPDVRILVVGNPVNTNCLVALRNGRDVPPERWTALLRLDENRARALLAAKAGVNVREVTQLAVWGNHSPTQFPDYLHARISGRPAPEVIGDETWLKTEFVERVRKRGAEVIKARGRSSAASAAHAVIGHLRARREGAAWTSMGVFSRGEYGLPSGVVCSYPVTCPGGGDWEIIPGLEFPREVWRIIQESAEELVAEKEAVRDLLP